MNQGLNNAMGSVDGDLLFSIKYNKKVGIFGMIFLLSLAVYSVVWEITNKKKGYYTTDAFISKIKSDGDTSWLYFNYQVENVDYKSVHKLLNDTLGLDSASIMKNRYRVIYKAENHEDAHLSLKK